MGIGESAAIVAAFFWAAASLLYGKTKLSATGMNLIKNSLATVVLVFQLAVSAKLNHAPMFVADAAAWKWLALSGIIGVLLGDTCYFRSLQILGPRKALIVSTTAPLFAAFLGLLFLNEAVTIKMLAGILVTSAAVVWVVSGRKTSDESPGLFPGSVRSGVAYAIMGAICQAVGAVFAKYGLQSCEPVEASFIRLAVSAVGSLIVVYFMGDLKSVLRTTADRQLLQRLIPAVLMGTWLGIWLSQIAYKHTSVAIATTLLSTTPLFAIPLVRLFYGHRITRPAIVGTIAAVFGVYLVVS